MTYHTNKKVSRQHWRDPHQKQYAPLPFGGVHNTESQYNSLPICYLFVTL